MSRKKNVPIKNIGNFNKDLLVYIVLPVYNGEKYFLEQLISIYNQNYSNWYLIIINDGSTDSSEAIAKDFVSHYNLHDKVKILKKENGGVNSAITKGLEEIKNMCNINTSDSLICYCDSDDVWTREKLSVQVNFMKQNSQCGLSYHDMAQIDNNSRIIKPSILNNHYHSDESFFALSIYNIHFYSTEIMFRAKYIDFLLPLPMDRQLFQDHRTVLVLSFLGVNIEFIDQQLVYYRCGHASLSNSVYSIPYAQFRQKLLYFKEIKERNFGCEPSYEYNYCTDRLRWGEQGKSSIFVCLCLLFKYPKAFFFLLKAFFYEKVLCVFK